MQCTSIAMCVRDPHQPDLQQEPSPCVSQKLVKPAGLLCIAAAFSLFSSTRPLFQLKGVERNFSSEHDNISSMGDGVWKGTRFERLILGQNDTMQTRVRGFIDYRPHEVCGRPTNTEALLAYGLLRDYSSCPVRETNRVLLMERRGYGRTGNRIIQFLHALHMSRRGDFVIGFMTNSDVLLEITRISMEIKVLHDWKQRFEEFFCVKIFSSEEELDRWNVTLLRPKQFFYWNYEDGLFTSPNTTFDDYVSRSTYWIRVLLNHWNTGYGTDVRSLPTKDMCSGINAITNGNLTKAYSVVHLRGMEGAAYRFLNKVCKHAGCDPLAPLEMRPEYIKSILAPLGMIEHPIVVITDGQNTTILDGLMTDREIGPMIRLVPEVASWYGGDMTLGIMSNVFIGNPASSFSGFITRSRLSIGFGESYLFRAKNEYDQWVTTCGPGCTFDPSIIGVHA